VPALGRPVYGVRRVVRTVATGIRAVERAGGFEVRRAEINGEAGALIVGPDGGLIAVWSLGIADDRVQSIRSVTNPDKLAHLGSASGVWAMLDRSRGGRPRLRG
jgi:hypothetical protein